ncbi:MAG TPA: glycosyltransferase family 1 protein [Bryobacteraceae bacterium]|nr:glycosyltransferase family 1 protein [Bryobacteraceae bacterium]
MTDASVRLPRRDPSDLHYHRMMKIALDATPLAVASGGVRRYTEELSRALAQNFPEDEFWLLSDQKFAPPQHSPPNLKIGQGPRNMLERRWWLWGLQGEISRLRLDLFHGTDFAVPYLHLRPAVMTLHDLSPWMDARWHAESDRVRKRTPMLLRLGLTNMVITPTEAVRRQAMERFRLAPGRVVAVPLAASEHFRPVDTTRQGPPYLLYLGTLEPRKNLAMLLDVWREVRRSYEIDLILAGRRRDDFPELSPEPGLRAMGLTTEDELPRLYSGALACVYPSYYEGFGLPVLEAMQCGAAVVASRDPAIMEVAADAALLLDVGDPRAWAEALRALMSEPDRLAAMREKALARAAEFSWTKTAKLTREVYGQAARRFRKQA